MSDGGAIRYDVIFTGRVQGVGFRYTTCRVARDFAVTGWVRNEPDGSVRCVVQGAGDELDRFVAAVQAAMSGSVRETRIDRHAAGEPIEGFTVRY